LVPLGRPTNEVAELYLGQKPISGGVMGYLLGPWQRWDALWYTKIAQFGYDRADGSTNLFPLYPLLIGCTARLLGGQFLLAGIILSNLAFIASLTYFYRLVKYESGELLARRSIMYLAFFPTAFFFLAPYTESLLLLCIIGAFYYARRRKWLRVGLFGLGAGLTKIPAVLITIPLLWEYMESLKENQSRPNASMLLTVTPAFGSLSYMIYRYVFVGDITMLSGSVEIWQVKLLLHHPFVFPAAAQQTWRWRFVMPWESLVQGVETVLMSADIISRVRAYLELSAVASLGVATVSAFTRLSRSYAIYMLLLFLSVLMWVDTPRPFSTIYRHSLLFFPLFILLGGTGQRTWFHRVLLLAFVSLLAIFTAFYVGWYWMG